MAQDTGMSVLKGKNRGEELAIREASGVLANSASASVSASVCVFVKVCSGVGLWPWGLICPGASKW